MSKFQCLSSIKKNVEVTWQLELGGWFPEGTRRLLYCLLFSHEKVKSREEKTKKERPFLSDVAEHIQAHPISIVCARLKKQRQTSNQWNLAEPERHRKKHNFNHLSATRDKIYMTSCHVVSVTTKKLHNSSQSFSKESTSPLLQRNLAKLLAEFGSGMKQSKHSGPFSLLTSLSLSLSLALVLAHSDTPACFLLHSYGFVKLLLRSRRLHKKGGKSDDRPHLFFIPSVANVLLHEFILHAFSISSNLLLLKERINEHKKLRHDGSCGFSCHFHPFSGSGPRLFAGHLLEPIARANYVHSDWLHNVWTVFARCLL